MCKYKLVGRRNPVTTLYNFHTNSAVHQKEVAILGLSAKYFGLAKLHQWQLSAIGSAIEGKDSLIVQPTGTGKSLCFCIPPLYSKKTAIVVSPTISLMTDQVLKLEKKGIPATLLGSAQKEDVTMKVEEGEFRLVFTTPESFIDKVTGEPRPLFIRMATEGKLCLLAVDEAHLIDSWKLFR